MTDGTSQGLFVVVSIVIFGVFVALSYQVFGSEGLTNDLTGLVSESLSQTESRVNNGRLVYSDNREVSYLDDNQSQTEHITYGVDLAPVFDTHGLGEYLFVFDAKAELAGNMILYAHDGRSYKYQLGHRLFEVDTEYTQQQVTVNVSLNDADVDRSHVSFFGYYGTGVLPSVRNLRIYKVR